MVVCYGQTGTFGQKNHLETSDSETSGTMCLIILILFLFMYLVPQKNIVNQAAEIKKIHKMYVRDDFSENY